MSRSAADVVINIKENAEANNQAVEFEYPEDFNCPISLELMRDPVIADDNFTYDRKLIEDFIQKTQKSNFPYPPTIISPQTGKPMTTNLRPNETFKAAIGAYKDKAIAAKKKTDQDNKEYLDGEILRIQLEARKNQEAALNKQKAELEQGFHAALKAAAEKMQSAMHSIITDNNNLNNAQAAQITRLQTEAQTLKQLNAALQQKLLSYHVEQPAAPAAASAKAAALSLVGGKVDADYPAKPTPVSSPLILSSAAPYVYANGKAIVSASKSLAGHNNGNSKGSDDEKDVLDALGAYSI